MKHVKLFEQFTKSLNEGISASDQKKLKEFAYEMSDEIIDANQDNSGFDEDAFTGDALLSYLLDLIEMNDMTVKELLADYDWRENTIELGL